MLLGWALLGVSLGAALVLPSDILRSVGGLPAHIAGRFEDLASCQQSTDGTIYLFDRRLHAVFSVAPGADAPRELVQIGAEPGRILRPYAFDLAPDDTFVVADAPQNRARVQFFLASGDRVGGFSLHVRDVPIVADSVVISGLASLAYTGRSIYLSQPAAGALITEQGVDGVSVRTFGQLRPTGHESDRDLHIALNSGLVVLNPAGGFYYVFVAGVPMFRKYDVSGALIFERHIEGVELDDYMRDRPTVWPRRKTDEGEFPIVRPAVRAAAADAAGNLWITLDVPFTYVYDAQGDKQRVVQFRSTGIFSPTSLSFTPNGRILATPGCYLFDPRTPSQKK
jgi:hypothetical protein